MPIIDTVIAKMRNLKGDERKARMSIALALQVSTDKIFTAFGFLEGVVPEKPYEKLENHLPYRSLLFLPQLSKWFYNLTEQEENNLGYRKAAFEKILKNLKYYDQTYRKPN